MQKYACSWGHTQEIDFPPGEAPATIVCAVHMSTTHAPGCAEWHACREIATRISEKED